MERSEMLETLLDLSGPLGPFQIPDVRERTRRVWWGTLLPSDAEGLVSLLRERPEPARYLPLPWDTLELEIEDALAALGRRDPPGLIARLGPHLESPAARPALFDVLGGLGQAALPWLAPWAARADLTPDEAIRLAGALGALDGPEARALLLRLAEQPAAKDPEVRQEIALALGPT